MLVISRRTTFFEKILLIAGFFIGVLGFFIINTIYVNSGRVFGFDMVTVVFLWIILLFMMIIVATAENQKEESLNISRELHEETKLMKSLMKEQVYEIKLLRQDLAKLNSKKRK